MRKRRALAFVNTAQCQDEKKRITVTSCGLNGLKSATLESQAQTEKIKV